MDIENSVFGKRIREMREYQKLSREKLSEMADISTQFLADIETGRKGMSAITLKKICDALHISADSIVYGSDNKTDSNLESIVSRIPENKRSDFEQAVSLIARIIE